MNEMYSRQIKLKEIGTRQKKLESACVAIIGLGALGSNSANLLIRSGIGKIILVDRDFVELSNLGSQNMYEKKDIGTPKSIAMKKHVKLINPDVIAEPIVDDLNNRNIEKVLSNVDLIIDGTDNLETRFLINDFAVKNKIPWIYGSCIGTIGMSCNIIPNEFCFRCVVNVTKKHGMLDTCETVGVINSIATIISARQVTECIKILTGQPSSGKMFIVDMWNDKSDLVNVKKNRNCETCGKSNFEFLEGRVTTKTTKLCGLNTYHITLSKKIIDFEELDKKLKAAGNVNFNEYVFHFIKGDKRLSIFRDGRVIVKGVGNEREAKSFYSKYIE